MTEAPDVSETEMVPEDVRDAIKVKNAFSGFCNTEGWKLLVAWIEDQVRMRGDDVILKPLENILEATKQEFTKGEMAFGRTVLAFPETLLTTAQETINEYNAIKEEDDGEERDDGDGDTLDGTAYGGGGDEDGDARSLDD